MFVPCLVEIGLGVHEKKDYEFRQSTFAISLLSLFGIGRGPSFEQN